jgi:predicted NBD/HSP70 family sugar kinase
MAFLVKNDNYRKVLRSIWLNPGIPRIEIASTLGLDKSTITNIITKLIDLEIVAPIAEGEASRQGGRKPIKLSLDDSKRYILGIEIQPESYTILILNLHGKVLKTKQGIMEIEAENFKTVLHQIILEGESLVESLQGYLIGVGLGLSGIIDPIQNKIIRSNPLNIDSEINSINEISEELGVPIFVENDANCCAWAELVMNRAKPPQNFLSILLEFRTKDDPQSRYSGIALGLGIVNNGMVHHGEQFSAGEFRSIFWKPGNRSQFSLSDEESFMVRDNPEIFNRFAKELGQNVAFLVNILNLSHIYLAGDQIPYEDKLKKELSSSIKENWSYQSEVHNEILRASHPEDAVAYGAGAMLLEKIFSYSDVFVDRNISTEIMRKVYEKIETIVN